MWPYLHLLCTIEVDLLGVLFYSKVGLSLSLSSIELNYLLFVFSRAAKKRLVAGATSSSSN